MSFVINSIVNYAFFELYQNEKSGISSSNVLPKSAWKMLKYCKINRIGNARKACGARKQEVEAEADAGSGPFSVEAEPRKIYRFYFHIGYLT